MMSAATVRTMVTSIDRSRWQSILDTEMITARK